MIRGFEPWIEKNASGNLRLCVRYRDELTGKVKKVSTRLDKDTKKARREAEAVLLEKIDKSENRTEHDTLTYGELVELYISDIQADVSLKDSTKRRNTVCARTMAKIIGEDILVSKLHTVDVLGLLTKTGETAERKNNRLERFKVLVRWAYRHNYIEHVDFLMKLKPFSCHPHTDQIIDKFMDSTELHRVLEEMNGEHHVLMTWFLGLSGLRIGEAIALRKSDVDVTARTIHVVNTYDPNAKTSSVAKTQASVRDVHIQPQLLELLRQIEVFYKRMELRTGKRSELLFHKEDGKPYSYYAYLKQLGIASQKALGRRLTPHALRHTHASILFESSFTPDEVARRLGHSKSDITKRIYIHTTKTLQERDNAKLDVFRIG